MVERFIHDKLLTPGLVEAVMYPFKIPETAAQAPEHLFLKQPIYGDFIHALIRQEKSTKPVEESQFMGMQRDSVIFAHTPVFKGLPDRTNDAGEEAQRWFRKNPTVVSYWHTHIPSKSPYFTPDDIARSINFADRAVITLLGSQRAISALVRAKKFEHIPKGPLGAINRDTQLYEEISAIYNSSQEPPDFSALANYLEKKGFVLYLWSNPDKITVAQAAHQGQFKNSIAMRVVRAR